MLNLGYHNSTQKQSKKQKRHIKSYFGANALQILKHFSKSVALPLKALSISTLLAHRS
jgi:hypothetical protein